MIPKKAPGVLFTALAAFGLQTSVPLPPAQKEARTLFCDSELTLLFTPRTPLLGRYEVCADPRPLGELASDWKVESFEPADAFGTAGSADRAALARLYGGTRAQVARGWTLAADRFEAVTLVSPYPNVRLTRLEFGTLVIRWVCDLGHAECKIKISDAR